MVGNNRLAGAQCKAGGRGQIGPDTGRAYHAFIPANPGAHQEAVLGRKIFQYLAEFCPEPFGRQSGGVVEQIDELRALEGQNSEFGKNSC